QLAHEIEVEADRFVFLVEETEGRRVELHAGEKLAAFLDLGERSLRRLRSGRDGGGKGGNHCKEKRESSKQRHRCRPFASNSHPGDAIESFVELAVRAGHGKPHVPRAGAAEG